jgi:hypothetical protein
MNNEHLATPTPGDRSLEHRIALAGGSTVENEYIEHFHLIVDRKKSSSLKLRQQLLGVFS